METACDLDKLWLSGTTVMQVKVQAWGNSLGLRTPKAYAQQLHVGPGSTLELSMEAGVLVAKPSAAVELTALLDRVNPNNTHHELDWGQLSGDELW